MSLFSSLFGKKPESEEAPVPQTGPGAPAGFFPEGVNMSDWDQVFSACVLFVILAINKTILLLFI